ncbi:MAG: SdrD B-like domain, partial [Bacteroidota bacterium]
MKSKFILPLFLFLFTVFFSNSQSRYKFEWERLIANTAYNRSSILTDIDGNVYCHTQGSLLSGPLNQISFSKLDKFGNLIFGLRSPYNGSVINGTPMSCTLLSDENFLLLDHEVANNSIVTKMDRNGRVIWQRQFVNKQYQCVREGKDGKIFLGGFYMTPQQFKFRILDQNGQNDLEISPINPDTLNGSLSMVQAFKGKVIYGHDRVSDQALEYYDSLLGVNQITTGNYLFLLDFFDDYFLTNNGGYLQIYDSTLTVRLTKYGDHSPYYGDQFITSEKEFLYVSTSYNPDGRAFVFMTDSNFQTMIDTVWIDPTIRYQGFSNIQEFNNEYYFSFVHGAIGYGPSYMKNYKIDMNKNVVFLGQYDSNGQSNFNSALFEGSSVRYLAVVDTFQARKLVCYSTKSFKAEGTVFYDADSDGVFDSSEYGIPGYKLLTLPDSNFIFTDHNGHYEMYADSLELIEVLNVPNTFCYLTTATSSYQYIGSQAGNAGMNFGLMYYEEDIAINTITPTVVTCIDPFGYNVKIKNLGSNPWKAVLKINKDINSNFEGLIGNATFTVAGNLVQIFSVDTVFPGQELNLFLKLTINNPSLFNPIQCSFSLEKPDGFDLTPSFSIISP